MKRNRFRDESGMALVLTMGILLLVTLMAVGFFSTQDIESKASRNYSYSVVAEEMAQGAVDRAIALLTEDRDTTVNDSDSEFMRLDSLYELWGPKYPGNDERRFSAQAGDDSADLDPIIEGANGASADARWILVTDGRGRPVGRFAVLVMPENSKININTAGNREPWANIDVLAFDGYSPYAINLENFLNSISSSAITDYERILNWRWCGDPDDDSSGPGFNGIDDNDNNGYLERDGVDNDSDGLVDEADEGIDDPYEYGMSQGTSPSIRRLTGDDFAYLDPIMALFASTGSAADAKRYYKDSDHLASYLTATSYTNELLDFEGNPRVSINKMAFPYQTGAADADAANKSDLAEEIRDLITSTYPGALTDDEAAQLAVNIVDYSDYDYSDDDDIRADVRTKLDRAGQVRKPYLGVEKTVYINEINSRAYEDTNPMYDRHTDNVYIELINISDRDVDLSNWRFEICDGDTLLNTLAIPAAASATIGSWSGWGGDNHYLVFAVEKGPDPVVMAGGVPQPPTDNGIGGWSGNAHSFMNEWPGADGSKVINYPLLANHLDENNANRLVLKDNNGNIVDVVDYTDTVDGGQPTQITSWQKDDPTTDLGAEVQTQTALSVNASTSGDRPTNAAEYALRWLRTDGTNYEARNVKDRYFASVAELAKVSFPPTQEGGSWRQYRPFVFSDEISSSATRINLLFAIFDKLTIYAEFASTSLTTSVEGTAVSAPSTGRFAISEATVRGKININTIMNAQHAQIYRALRVPSTASLDFYPHFANWLETQVNIGPFGMPDDNGHAGLGGLSRLGTDLSIQDFIAVSNLLTTQSNVFKIIVIAQAYDNRFNIAAERKLEVIVDRGHVIDDTAEVLSFRWVTEED